MQKQKKLSARILSIVLTAAMVFTTFPATTFAVEGTDPLAANDTPTTQEGTTPLELETNADITFDARNGDTIANAKSTITPPTPTWGDYTFDGWYTGIDGAGTEVKADTVRLANTTVYAKWTKGNLTVRTTPLDLRDMSSTTNSKEGWAWNSTNKTLTLSGAQIFGTGEGYGIMLPTKSKIVLSEGTTSNVTGGSELCLLFNAGPNSLYGSCGIFCETTQEDNPSADEDGKLTITGKGKLVATGGDLSACTNNVSQVSSGIGSTIHITVEGADVTATGGRLSPFANLDNEWALMSAGMYALGGTVEINGAAKVIATGADCDTYRDSFGIQGTVTIKDSADVTAIAGKGETSNGIDSDSEMTMIGGTLSASGEVAISARPITAAGATVTNGTADNEGGKFVSGTTNTLTQTDTKSPVIIKFTNSVTFDARNGVAIKDADIDKDKGTITAMPTAPTWEGYKFEGWYTGIDGAGTEFVNSGLTANTTVYAKWTATNGKTVRTTPLDLLADSVTPAADQGWTWADNTLTLSGATIDCSGNTAVTTDAFGVKLPDMAKIVLTTDSINTVNAGNTIDDYITSNGIYFVGGEETPTSSSISGKGTLYATSGVGGSTNASFGIVCRDATLTLSDATVHASSTKSNIGCGIGAYLDVQSGTITAIGTGAALCFGINTPGMTMSGGTVTATGNASSMANGIVAGTLELTGGTLSASGTAAVVMMAESPIIAVGATVTNGTADNGSFVSGTTKTLTQTDPTQPVKISFTKSVTFDARNGVAIENAKIDKDKGTIAALPANPTWENYTFAGWYTGIDGTGEVFKNENLTANTAVYAKWTATNGKTVRTTPLDLTTGSVIPAADQGWTWNEETNTLTLSGATIDCSKNPAVADVEVFGIQLLTAHNIVLTDGTINTVKAGDSSNTMSVGVGFTSGELRSVASPSISGKGTLYAMSTGKTDAINTGIACMDDTPLTLSDATLVATAAESDAGVGIMATLHVKSGTITTTGTGAEAGYGISASSITISGGTVTATGIDSGILGGTLEMTGGTLSATGQRADFESGQIVAIAMQDGITAANATITGAKETFESGITATLTQSGTDPVVISFIPKISFDARNGAPSENAEISAGGTITMPANPEWGDYTFDGWYTEMDGAGTKFENNGLTVSTTVYANWTKDGKSVRTTPLDFTNATTNLEGDGWMWDNDSKTLTLSGLALNSAKLDNNSDAVGIKFPTGPCTIILVDGTENAVDVSLAQNSTDSWGIFAPGQLTIKTSGNGTPGKLNAIAGNTSGVSVGIYAGGGIVIESGNITATAGSSESDNSIGISADSGNIHIKGGTVNATGGKSGATGMAGSFGLYGANVQIDNGAVTATGGEAALSAGIVGGVSVKLNGGTIHAMGTTAAVAALYNDVVIGGGIANVKVNDESATIAKKTIGEMTISTLLTTEAAIITDAAIKFKPNYIGTNPLAANPFKAIRTHSSITLPSQTITGETVEYGIKNSGGTIVWQDSPTFSGLNPDTKYEFYTRVKGNDTHKAGTTSDATTIKTRKVPTTVSGNVTDSKGAAVSGATVTLTPSDPALKTTTDASGNYIISNVPEGVYSLIITKDDLTITETVTVDGTAVEGKNITLLAGTKNTVVESTAGTPEISAGDVNELLNDTNIGTTLEGDEKNAVDNGGSVEIKVKADLKTGDQLAADKSQIEDIAGNQKIDLLLDFSVLKTVKDSSGNTVTDGEKITKLANIIKIRLPIPADLQGKADLSLYRIHDGKPEKLSTSPDSNGEYYTIDPSGEFMTLYLKNFSTYALGYNAFTLTIVDGGTGVSGKGNYANGDTVTINAGSKGGYSFNGWTVTTGTVTLANPSNASTTFTMPGQNVTLTAGWTYTGGGGGGGTTTYPNSVNKPENGTVSMNPASPSKGQTVTITTKPDDGYVVKTIIVKDADGKTIAVTEKGENSYTFTQPKGKVTLAVTYAKAGDIYTDMLPTDWFYDAVTKATVNGWFKGTSDTTFSPYASTGRGMIATILHRMEGAPQANTTSFSDVAADAYYANAIAWAQAYNIVSGYGNGTYGPNDNVTREQLATILYRYATYKGYDVSKTAAFDSFADSKSVSAYAKEAMSWAVGNGLISGRDNNTLTPTETATRAELAVILVRFAELSK